MTDPRRRLRRLDGIKVNDLWSRIESRATGHGSPVPFPRGGSTAQRIATIFVAFAIFLSGGIFLVSRFDEAKPGTPSPSDESLVEEGAVADELRIGCTETGAIVETGVVALQPDGVHVSITNGFDARLLYLRDPEHLDSSIAWDLQPGQAVQRVVSMMDVGTWVAGCFSGSGTFDTREVPLSEYSPPFEIVDPGGFADDLRDASSCGESLPEPIASAGTEAPLAGPLDGWLTVQGFDHDTGEARAFFVRADGTEVEPVEVEAGQIQELELSPDGSKIALVIPDSDGDPTVTDASREDTEIYMMNRDGSELTRLTDNHASDDIVHWTPEGRLSFRSNRNGDLFIYTMDADGSDPRRLVAASADSHDWSSTEARLAYIGDVSRPDNVCSFSRELHVADADGSNPIALTEDELYEQDPSWSPDGRTIAFAASDQSDYAWEILLVNGDGSDLRRITDYAGYDQGPVWSPDGRLIAFTSDRFLGPEPHGESQGGLLYVMNADGSGVRPLLDPDDLGIGRPWDIYVTDWLL